MNFFKSVTNGLFSSTPKPEEKSDESSLKVENPDGTESKEEIYNKEDRASLWKIISSKLGMDVTVGVSLPVFFMEPLTVLQRQCEMLHFAELLDEGANCENSLDRLAYVAVFAATAYNGTERFGKPFNPILGETFEYEDKENNFRFIAEQVSHHPPISASHAESPNYVFWQDSRPTTKFLGNYIDLSPGSRTHVYFPKTRDHFVYSVLPTTRVNNLIIGSIWIDHFGTLVINNLKNGESCSLTFEKCGWLGSGRHAVNGYVKDASGNNALSITGKWSDSISVKWLYESGKEPKDTTKVLWKRPSNNSLGKHKFTEFCFKLNEASAQYTKVLPPTDSRLRPDRKGLEVADIGEAAMAKTKLEEKQRSDKRTREQRKETWAPRWFKEIPEENGHGNAWVYCGDYWEQRQKKMDLMATEEELSQGQLNSGSDDEEVTLEQIQRQKELLFGAAAIRGLACDFTGYTTNN